MCSFHQYSLLYCYIKWKWNHWNSFRCKLPTVPLCSWNRTHHPLLLLANAAKPIKYLDETVKGQDVGAALRAVTQCSLGQHWHSPPVSGTLSPSPRRFSLTRVMIRFCHPSYHTWHKPGALWRDRRSLKHKHRCVNHKGVRVKCSLQLRLTFKPYLFREGLNSCRFSSHSHTFRWFLLIGGTMGAECVRFTH